MFLLVFFTNNQQEVGLVIGGFAFAVGRFLILSLNKISIDGLIGSIRKDPSLAKEVSISLDIIYAQKENFPLRLYDVLNNYLRTTSGVGDYRILFVAAYEPDHQLIFTELSYVDFGVNAIGRSTDLNKKSFHNFVLKFERKKNILTVLSDIHSDATGRFQKQGFIDAVFKNGVGVGEGYQHH